MFVLKKITSESVSLVYITLNNLHNKQTNPIKV